MEDQTPVVIIVGDIVSVEIESLDPIRGQELLEAFRKNQFLKKLPRGRYRFNVIRKGSSEIVSLESVDGPDTYSYKSMTIKSEPDFGWDDRKILFRILIVCLLTAALAWELFP